MDTLLIWIVTFLYAGQACVGIYTKNYPMCLIFIGYSLANVGFIMSLDK